MVQGRPHLSLVLRPNQILGLCDHTNYDKAWSLALTELNCCYYIIICLEILYNQPIIFIK